MASRLSGFRKDDEEAERILLTADRHAIDARLLAALREAENGGPGREFGVLSVPAPTYADQADVAARTIANTIRRYERDHPGGAAIGADGRLTDDFLRYFSWGGPSYPGYAPRGAANDPSDLNANHYWNLAEAYRRIELV